MTRDEQRKRAVEMRLAGKSATEVAREMGVTRAWVYKLLEPTTDSPQSVKTCNTCGKSFCTSEPGGVVFCSPRCHDLHHKEYVKVSVQVEEEVWRALGLEPEQVTGAAVRDFLWRLAQGVKKRQG